MEDKILGLNFMIKLLSYSLPLGKRKQQENLTRISFLALNFKHDYYIGIIF